MKIMMSNGKKRNGFTLMELLVTMMALGIMTACAVPVLTGVIERNRSREAIAFLQTIHAAQKITMLNQDAYQPSWGATTTDIEDIKQMLRIDIIPQYYTYQITTVGNPATAYTATASRGNPGNKIFSINQTGVISESGTYA